VLASHPETLLQLVRAGANISIFQYFTSNDAIIPRACTGMWSGGRDGWALLWHASDSCHNDFT